jgi:peptidoglycan/xylan/chitin deacetylase (PgdA/CDA1 family)
MPLLILSALLAITTAEVGAQEPSPKPQPGLKWTEAQLKEAVAPVRSGRKLTPKSWPEGARVAVCLSFDVDTETWGLPTGEIAPVPLSAGEYGATSGLPRILQLLDRHDLPASFYIPAVSLILHPEMLPTLMKSGRHEIALHGWVHENLPDLDDAAEEERLLNQAIDYLTKAVGKRPVGYRAPSWAFSKHTLDLIRKAGFLYDSSLMGMDQPYEIDSNGKPTGMVELPVEWILDDAPFFEGYAGTLPAPEQVFRIYKDEFDVAYSEGTMFMLTMHPRVIGHRSRMLHLEEFVKYMKSKPGVWFATGEQIARYLKDSSPRTQPSRE